MKRNNFSVVLWILLVIAISGCRQRQLSAQLVNPSPEQVTEIMVEGAEMQVRQAKNKYGVTLDYTPDSIRTVETILGRLHEQYLKSEDDKHWRTEGIGWGAYVGEVIRRKYGGKWAKEDQKTGQRFPLSWGKSTSFPVSWCAKRIHNGDEDNVWFKYQLLTDPKMDEMIKQQK